MTAPAADNANVNGESVLPDAPRATARLQLHAGFTFADAAATIDYYAQLGISHLYLSPIFAARPGSTHGYDVTDHGRINPELGGEEGFAALVAQAQAAGLGIILDIVPNHMAADATHNAWWRDVLMRGRESRYAGHFDIDWEPANDHLHGKLLLPVLGKPYWEALTDGEIALDLTAGPPVIRCGGQEFPLNPPTLPADLSTLAPLADNPAGVALDRLHALLERQPYRLAWWRTAAAELNWRRFFEISELVGVRVEDPTVFDDVHALVLSLLARGWIDGVRVDHVDGLADPGAYCRVLRERVDAAAEAGRAARVARAKEGPEGVAMSGAGPLARPWIVVEKILAEQETLPLDWHVDGTTGYDFMNECGAVLHDGTGEAVLDALWERMAAEAGVPADYDALTHETRTAMLSYRLSSEYEATCRALHRVASAMPQTRDIPLASLRRATAALLVRLDVYRTYCSDQRPACEAQRNDKACLQAIRSEARQGLEPDDAVALDLILDCLAGKLQGAQAEAAHARRRLQQLMPPLAAKAEEDTAFYRYARLVSRNEVGSRPATLAFSPERYHVRMTARAQRMPRAMVATATHDHKRGEDTRLRIAVLSELAQPWRDAVDACEQAAHVARPGSAEPDGPDRLMVYQTLVGALPCDPRRMSTADERAAFAERLLAWQQKSIREAKRHGSWTGPDTRYEEASDTFLQALLTELHADAGNSGDAGNAGGGEDAGRPGQLLPGERLRRMARRVDCAAALSSLAQVTLQLTAPGVPDRYQGTETWDQSLVDPDNRRPVDFPRLREMLACSAGWEIWMREWRDGRIKLQLIRALLHARRADEALFLAGSYRGLGTAGPLAPHVLGFERCTEDRHAIVLATRLAARHVGPSSPLIPPPVWGETRAMLQGPGACDTTAATSVGRWRDVLTGKYHTLRDGQIVIADVLTVLPVAVLVPASP